ncbi:hematopoietic SH2 domain-containing protein homolog [Sphaeramia orbicularis]|uniref:SH2 domain-containing protein n=1 Tax=Sphaeramia orbicularis TaxID=375764 RepID=A0A673A132_9TELE|nr:hematopoietic SH2 domain-containing protein [Sphaeramia orbicularis]
MKMDWGLTQTQQDALTWFTKSQLQAVIRNGIIPEWFHGIISRKTAEELLMPKPPGYFLIRVSESRIGYTLSYRAEDRCRHFMIDALEDGDYIIVGENTRHRLLQDLVDFHRRTPIMPYSEVLTVPCGQATNDKVDYAELLFPQRRLTPNSISPPNNSIQPIKSHPVSQEDVPPALPHRPTNLRHSVALFPNSQPGRLYPSLEEQCSFVFSSPPDMPVPTTRKRYTVTDTTLSQPPAVASRSCMPLPKPNQSCIQTISSPQSPSAQDANVQPVKGQDTKPSVVSNLKNFKKKFQKKRSSSLEYVYEDINVGADQRAKSAESTEDTEHEYQEIPGLQQMVEGSHFSYNCTPVSDGVLPQEYLPPPPFAPGY